MEFNLHVPPSVQLYTNGEFHHFIDGLDETRSNWMRYVNPAHSVAEQNLAACQNGMEIYFYTVKPIPAGAELLVWYCHDFAQRLHYPPSGELMMQKLSKSLLFWTLFCVLIFWDTCVKGLMINNQKSAV